MQILHGANKITFSHQSVPEEVYKGTILLASIMLLIFSVDMLSPFVEGELSG